MLFFNGTLRTDRPQLSCAAICSELFVCLTWLHAVDEWKFSKQFSRTTFFPENREIKVRSESKFFFHLTVSPPSFQTFLVSFFIVACIKIFLHLIRRGLFIYTCSAVSQISLWASRGMKALFNQYLLPQPSVPWAWNNSHFLRYYLFHFTLSYSFELFYSCSLSFIRFTVLANSPFCAPAHCC